MDASWFLTKSKVETVKRQAIAKAQVGNGAAGGDYINIRAVFFEQILKVLEAFGFIFDKEGASHWQSFLENR